MVQIPVHAYPAFLGLAVGDALGAFVEFCVPSDPDVADFVIDPVMRPGGTWDLAAGQVTDDTEMAIALLRAMDSLPEYYGMLNHPMAFYREWLESRPFDVGSQTRKALMDGVFPASESQANGFTPRAALIGAVYAHFSPGLVLGSVIRDAGTTHGGAIAATTANLIAQLVVTSCYTRVHPMKVVAWFSDRLHPEVLAWTKDLNAKPSKGNIGWCRWPLQALLRELVRFYDGGCVVTENTLADGVLRAVADANDSDTVAAVVGAGLGAIVGVDGIPAAWREAVLGCVHTKRPRPNYHPALVVPTEGLAIGPR